MKIQDILKKAIQEEDWQILCDTYTYITGEAIAPPVKKDPPRFEDVEDDLDIDLSTHSSGVAPVQKKTAVKKKRGRPPKQSKKKEPVKQVTEEEETSQKKESKEPFEEFRIKPKINSKTVTLPKGERRPNLFNKGGYHELFEDERVDINKNDKTHGLGVQKVRPRMRKTPSKVKVECSSCHQQIEEYSSAFQGRDIETWKCTQCCINSGAGRD